MGFLKQKFAPNLYAALKSEKGKRAKEKPVEQEKKSFADNYGSKEELAEAYRRLQQKYHEREQRWKEYEERERITKDRNLWRDKVDALTREYPFAVSYVAEMGEYFRLYPEKLGKEGCLEEALLHVAGNNLPKGKDGEKVPTENADLHKKTDATPSEPETAEEPHGTATVEETGTKKSDEGAFVFQQEDSVSHGETQQKAEPPETETPSGQSSESKASAERFAPLMQKGGEIPLTAPLKPKSIREAGALALKLMEQK